MFAQGLAPRANAGAGEMPRPRYQVASIKEINMKRKPLVPRNPHVAPALFRKAGPHRKPEKARSRADKVQLDQFGGVTERSRYRSFKPADVGLNPTAPTSSF
jgi:hypothetical protein